MINFLSQPGAQVILKYVCILTAGFAATYFLTPLVKRFCSYVGLIDVPGDRHIHDRPIPCCGISVFIGFHVACAVAILVPWVPFRLNMDQTWWLNYVVVSSVLVVIGLIDDRWGMKPLIKLLGQVAVASLAYYFNMRVGRILDFTLPGPLDYIATVIWIVTIINAFNLVDGIDGLATGLASIACLGIFGSFMFRHMPGDALIVLGLLGACLGFLRYNFYPASIFLGDSGSMFLGCTLACVAVSSGAKGTTLASVLVPLLAVGVPLFDTVLAVWRRTVRRVLGGTYEEKSADGNVFHRDTDHVHHRLVKLGLTHREAASWLYAISVVLVAIGLLGLLYRSHALGIFIIAFVAGTYVVVRHLARVELWDSGMVIMRGIRRPDSKVVAVLLYPPLDVIALALALGVAVYFSASETNLTDLKLLWFDQIPFWVGIPFLWLVVTRTYKRVWSRARISEYVILAVSLLAGIVLSAGVHLISGQDATPLKVIVVDFDIVPKFTLALAQPVHHGFLQQILIFTGVSMTLIVGLRAMPRAIQDAMGWAHLRRDSSAGERRRILIYGADYGCTLYLLEHSYRRPGRNDQPHVIGLLDDDANLHGRFVHGCRVLGGIEKASAIVKEMKIDEIVVTESIREDIMNRLMTTAGAFGARLSTWQTTSQLIVPEQSESHSKSV